MIRMKDRIVLLVVCLLLGCFNALYARDCTIISGMIVDGEVSDYVGMAVNDTISTEVDCASQDTGTIDIATFPDSVEILYSGRKYMSDFDEVLSVGKHHFRFSKSGYISVDTTFSVNKNIAGYYSVVLSRMALPVAMTKSKRRLNTLIMPQLGYNQDLSLGVMIGFLRRNGFYVKALASLESGSSSYVCSESGVIQIEGQPCYPYYKNDVASHPGFSVSTGYLRELWKPLIVYVGAGYGSRKVIWETIDGAKVDNDGLSAIGIAAECGAILRLGKFAVSCGVQTINFTYSEMQFGLGFIF